METSKEDIPSEQIKINPGKEARALSADELKHLTDFFFILIQIDRRVNKKMYGKQDK